MYKHPGQSKHLPCLIKKTTTHWCVYIEPPHLCTHIHPTINMQTGMEVFKHFNTLERQWTRLVVVLKTSGWPLYSAVGIRTNQNFAPATASPMRIQEAVFTPCSGVHGLESVSGQAPGWNNIYRSMTSPHSMVCWTLVWSCRHSSVYSHLVLTFSWTLLLSRCSIQ